MPGRPGGDGRVEVGEPVVDQRCAGEVGHLRRKLPAFSDWAIDR